MLHAACCMLHQRCRTGALWQEFNYWLLTWSVWVVAITWVFAPFWFNPLGFHWGKTLKDFDEWRKWMKREDDSATRSWRQWYSLQHATGQHPACNIQDSTCNMKQACSIQRKMCNMQRATSTIQCAARSSSCGRA